ncbi:MAG: hypothetical protein ACI4J5_10160 [Oscillospiraceae bacterium]
MKKIYKYIIGALAVILVLVLFFVRKDICRAIYVSQNKDICIYTHPEDRFVYMAEIPDESSDSGDARNEFLLRIYSYEKLGFIDDHILEVNHYYDDTEHPYHLEFFTVNIPDEYGTAEEIVSIEALTEEDMSAYGFKKYEYEYSNNVLEQIKLYSVTMSDGSQYVIYKRFNKLYMRGEPEREGDK